MDDERAAEGLDHLQAAALEMIQAARAFLDIAEDLVADRDKVAEVVGALGSVADVATRAAKARGVHEDRSAAGSPAGARPAGAGAADGGDGVQHIRVTT